MFVQPEVFIIAWLDLELWMSGYVYVYILKFKLIILKFKFHSFDQSAFVLQPFPYPAVGI